MTGKNITSFKCVLFIACILGSATFTGPAAAANGAAGFSHQSTSYQAAFTPFCQFETDLDDGGGFSVFGISMTTGLSRDIALPARLGLSIDYDYADYDFSGTTSFGGPEPWGEIHGAGIGINLSRTLGESWRVFAGPSVRLSGEAGSRWTDALVYGVTFSVVHTAGRYFSIGAGAGLFSDIEEVKIFPMLLIHWKINEKLTITNPLRSGPTGSGGLEVMYSLNETTRFGSGAAYRSARFRLDDDGVAPRGIGEVKSGIFWCRLSHTLGNTFDISLYAGMPFTGKLSLENRDGGTLGSDLYGPAAFAALTIHSRF